MRLIVPRHGTYWRLDERLRRVEEGYPLQVGDRWAEIPNDIDAAFTYKDGKWTYDLNLNSKGSVLG